MLGILDPENYIGLVQYTSNNVEKLALICLSKNDTNPDITKRKDVLWKNNFGKPFLLGACCILLCLKPYINIGLSSSVALFYVTLYHTTS